jgi:hypothetical protein
VEAGRFGRERSKAFRTAFRCLHVVRDLRIPGVEIHHVRGAQRREQKRVVTDEIERILEELNRVRERRRAEDPHRLARLQVELVCAHIVDGPLGEPPFFLGAQLEPQRLDDGT